MEENKTQETVEQVEVQNEPTNEETVPQVNSNFDAKQIRQATEEKVARKFEKEKQELEKSYQEKLAKLEEKTNAIEENLKKKEEEAIKLAQDMKLKEWGVPSESIEDMRILTSKAETEEEAQQIVSRYIKPANTTAPQKIQQEETSKKSLKEIADSYYGF